MKKKCKYCECGNNNYSFIDVGLVSDEGLPVLNLIATIFELDNGGHEMDTTVFCGDIDLIDNKIPINYCPFCGRKLSTEVVEP